MWCLFSFGVSTLKRGDDPYAILGVSHDATFEQIRSAFRKISFDLHPDRSKGEDSAEKWMRANDAYELLSNAQRKLNFDQNGQIEDIEQPQTTATTSFQSSFQSSSVKKTPLITEQVFKYLAKDGSPWCIFIFQSFDCPKCSQQSEIWEQFAQTIQEFFKVGRIDASQAPNLCEELGVSKFPCFVTVSYVNGVYQKRILGSHFRNIDGLKKVLFSQSKSKISTINQGGLTNWIGFSFQPHILEIGVKDPSVSFYYAASNLVGPMYATLDISIAQAKELWNINELPAILVFRGHGKPPHVIYSAGRRLLDDIEDAIPPLFPPIDWDNVKSICSDWCIATIDTEVNQSLIDYADYHPFATALIQTHSQIARYLHLEEGQWIVISKASDYFLTKPVSDPNDFAILSSKIYRSESIEAVLGPPHGSLDAGFSSWSSPVDFLLKKLPFSINNGAIVALNGSIFIPMPIVIIVITLLAVFLFVGGVTSHTLVPPSNEENEEKKKEEKRDTEEEHPHSD